MFFSSTIFFHFCFFFCSICHSVMSSVQLSVCLSSMAGPSPPPPKMWFLGSSANFKQFSFSDFFFHLQKFFHFHFFMHFWMFHAFLSAQKKFSPQIFFHSEERAVGEARHDTMPPSILVFGISITESSKVSGSVKHTNLLNGPLLFYNFQAFLVDQVGCQRLQLLWLHSDPLAALWSIFFTLTELRVHSICKKVHPDVGWALSVWTIMVWGVGVHGPCAQT